MVTRSAPTLRLAVCRGFEGSIRMGVWPQLQFAQRTHPNSPEGLRLCEFGVLASSRVWDTRKRRVMENVLLRFVHLRRAKRPRPAGSETLRNTETGVLLGRISIHIYIYQGTPGLRDSHPLWFESGRR